MPSIALLGISFLTGGALLWILLRLFTRPIRIPAGLLPQLISPSPDTACLYYSPGQKMLGADRTARKWFASFRPLTLESLAQNADPEEDFLRLAAFEGRVLIRIDGGLYHARSRQRFQTMEISLRRIPPAVLPAPPTPGRFDVPWAALSDLDMPDTVQNLLQSLLPLTPADWAMLTRWDPERRMLIRQGTIAARTLPPGHMLPAQEIALEADLTGEVARTRQPLRKNPPPKTNGKGFSAYLGFPLLAAGELLGTVDFYSESQDAFPEHLAAELSPQIELAALAIRNAQYYEEQKRRTTEATFLADLSAGAENMQDLSKLVGGLAVELARAADAEAAGFFLLEESSQTLSFQLPGFGIPIERARTLRINLAPHTPARALWLTNKPVSKCGATVKRFMREIGLAEEDTSVAWESICLLPLAAEPPFSGWAILANHRQGSFPEDTLRRLQPLAWRAGQLIRGGQFIDESRNRLRLADSLRQLSATASEANPPEKNLQRMLRLAAEAVKADGAALLLPDETQNRLRLATETALGLTESELAALANFVPAGILPSLGNADGQPRIATQPSSPTLSPHWGDYLQASATIEIPLTPGASSAGFAILFRRQGAFSAADRDFLAGAAGCVMNVREQSRFTSASDATLQRRVRQLTALAQISNELNSKIELPSLLPMIFGELLRVSGAEGGRIAIVDPEQTTGAVRPILLVGSPLPTGMLSAPETSVLGDIRSRRFAASESEMMELGCRNAPWALLLPVRYREQAVGIISLFAANPQILDEACQEFSETIALQIAIAFGNAQRNVEQSQTEATLRQRKRQLAILHQFAGLPFSRTTLADQMRAVAAGVEDALGFSPVAVGMLRNGMLEWIAASGLSAESWQRAYRTRISAAFLPSAGLDEAGSRFIPAGTGAPEWESIRQSLGMETQGQPLLCSILLTREKEPIGLLVAASTTHAPPSAQTLDMMETFSAQVSLVLAAAMGASRPATPMASRGEPPIEILDLQKRLSRFLSFHQVTESLSNLPNIQTILETLAHQLRETFSLDTVLIVEESPSGPRLRCMVNPASPDAPVDMWLGLNNPVLSVLQRGETILSLAVEEDAVWKNSPLLKTLQARSFVCFPIQARRNLLTAVLLVSRPFETPLTTGDADLFRMLGEQTATLLENAHLLEETRRRLREDNVLLEFSRKVAALDLAAILQALADGLRDALPEAEGAMVAVWDDAQETLIVRAAVGYSNPNRIRTIACQPNEGPLGRVYAEGNSIRWATLDMASAYNLRPHNLEAYRSGAGGMVPLSSLAIPLQAGEKRLGALLLENFSSADAFSANAEDVAFSLANQAALALEKARLFEEMMDRTRELDERVSHLALLNRLSSAAVTTSSENALLQAACRELANAFDVPQAAAALLEPDRETATVTVEYIYPGRPSGLGAHLPIRSVEPIQMVLQTRSPMQVDNALTDPRLESLRPWLMAQQATSLLLIPLIVANEAAGLFLVESPAPHPFSLADLSLAHTVASQLGQALENVRLHLSARSLTTDLEERVAERTTALDREHRRAETLLRVSTELVASLDLELVLHRALELVNEAIGADQAAVILTDPDTLQLVFRASLDRENKPPSGGRPIPFHVGEGLAGWVIQQRQAVILPDISADSRWVHLYPDDEPRYRSALAVPLMVGADALGALLLLSRDPAVFNPEQLSLASAAANQVASTINNAELYRLIRDQADRLGGLVRAQQVETRKSRAMLEAVADGVMVTDSDHYIVLFNQAAERVLALPRQKVQGHPAAEYMGLFGKAGRAWLNSLHRWRQSPAEISAHEYLSEQITLENGNVISVHLAPIASGEEYDGAVAVFRDITHEVEVDRLKSEFVATVSHELRTPMTAIKGYVEILLMGAAGELGSQQRGFLEIVIHNTERLEQLVDSLLNISRAEAGHIRLVNDAVDVRPLVEEVAAALRAQCQQSGKKLDVRVDIEDGIGSFLADLLRVREILDNLTENAYLYTPDGGTITIGAHQAKDGVQFDIVDTGIGIPTADQKRMFERFFRGTDPLVMATAGTGLGLSITRHLVELHGGQIWMESDGVPGHGSAFHVILPRDGVQST
jgi:PAS domain S-box-containing protein